VDPGFAATTKKQRMNARPIPTYREEHHRMDQTSIYKRSCPTNFATLSSGPSRSKGQREGVSEVICMAVRDRPVCNLTVLIAILFKFQFPNRGENDGRGSEHARRKDLRV
jgi:hypothetical protein